MSADWDASPWSCGGPVVTKVPKPKAVPVEKERKEKEEKEEDGEKKEKEKDPSLNTPPPPYRKKKKKKDVPKRLKPEKWRGVFDAEGRAVGFQKVLKLIAHGGVDPSIRGEVWEFLLGCYSVGSSAEYRQELRALRRERYRKLIEQCQKMHASIGTGTLAYTVGSKVMDVRIMSKDTARKEAKMVNLEHTAQVDVSREEEISQLSAIDKVANSPEFEVSCDFESSFRNVSVGFDAVYNASDLGSKEGVVDATLDFSEETLKSPPENNFEDLDLAENGTDSPTPIATGRDDSGTANSGLLTNPNGGIGEVKSRSSKPDGSHPKRLFSSDGGPLSWSAGSLKRIKSRLVRDKRKKDRGPDSPVGEGYDVHTRPLRRHTEVLPELTGASVSVDRHEPVVALGKNASEEKVAEWLWILHRIVVDVVRTDRHLEFYGDAKNMARMSDILAVYAWIDPDTGYCQGMSDLLSPFIVLFEDDADAFWCFESLIRRVRQNFQMEGPVGVMKQLEALSKILDVTDPQMSKHLEVVGADNFLFAFRMLLVLFRRELPFADSLIMWEMMWAADFNMAMAWSIDLHCVDALVLRLPAALFQLDSGRIEDMSFSAPPSMTFGPRDVNSPMREYTFDANSVLHSGQFVPNFHPKTPFCGLRPGALFMKHHHRMLPSLNSFLGKNGDEELSVFCVAAILVQNRAKLLKEVQSLDDAIKIFNDMNFVIRVHSCIQTASKMRKKYRSRLAKNLIIERWSSMTYS